MPIQNLFGQDGRFFDLLESGASEAKTAAGILIQLAAAPSDHHLDTLLGDIGVSRRRHKRIVGETRGAVIAAFATPIDREDIERLSSSLYRISKNIEKA